MVINNKSLQEEETVSKKTLTKDLVFKQIFGSVEGYQILKILLQKDEFKVSEISEATQFSDELVLKYLNILSALNIVRVKEPEQSKICGLNFENVIVIEIRRLYNLWEDGF